MKIYQPTAQVEMDNGTTSYVGAYLLSFRKPDIDTYSCNIPNKELYVFQYNPLELEQKCKNDKVALRGNRLDEFLEIFKANKIIVGRKAWVKSPIELRDGSYLTAFTQVVFNGVDLKPDQPIPDLFSAKMRMLINGTEVETEYGLPASLATKLTSENIEKKLVKKWGSKIVKAIKEQKIVLGMTREQTIMAWGKPLDIHETVGKWGKHEQWVYGDNQQYLYFENGKLTSYQD